MNEYGDQYEPMNGQVPPTEEPVSEEALPAEDVNASFDPPIPEAQEPIREASAAWQTQGPNDGAYHYRPQSEPIFTARPAQSEAPRREPQVEPQKPRVKKQSGGSWRKAVALALVCMLLGGAAGFGGALLTNKLQNQDRSLDSGSGQASVQVATPRETVDLNVVSVDSGKLLTAAQVYAQNVNSTVGITTEIINTNYWGYQSKSAAAGSGFILTEDGYILTNQHVIENASSITVAMYDGTTYAATLIGYDVSNDIAVLKIDAKGLTPVVLGNSDDLHVGDDVVAIGNPLGELTFSQTKGTVSALDRAVTLSSSVTMNLIQTDTAINSGNSGGALFNLYGEVVGITNAKYSSSVYSGQASIDNIGFAIPINSVRDIVSSIIEKGYISRPYIGVSVSNVSEESQSYGMPQGAAIRDVEKDGPAAKGGLQANDIVTAINGETITSYEELAKRVSSSEPGDELTFTVYRRGETLTLTITVGETTQEALPSTQDQNQNQNQNGQEGQNDQNNQNNQNNQTNPYGPDQFGNFPWGWFFGN